jgi:hypothetical protein
MLRCLPHSLVLFGLSQALALAQVGSLDTADGRRLAGWAATGPGDDAAATVGVFVDREATGEPDVQGLAATRRADLDSLGINGRGFDVGLPRELRDGQRHQMTVALREADGSWTALPGSPREVFCEPPMPMPEPLAEAGRAAIPPDSQIWYGAEDTWAMPVQNVWAACGPARDQWTFVQRHVQALALHNNTIAGGTREQLADLKAVVDANGLAMVAEMGGLEQWRAPAGDQFGEESAREEMSWSKLWWLPPEDGGCGGRYDYIIMDDPIYRGLFPAEKDEGRSVDEIANEIADAALLWCERFPGLRVVLGCNFPNWGWKGEPAYSDMPTMGGPLGRGDYYPTLLRTVETLRQRKVPLWGLILDNPYDYVEKQAASNQPERIAPLDFVARLRDVEETARALGLKFGLYMNTNLQDLEPEGILTPAERDQMYYTHVRSYFERYRAAGGEPDFWSTYSWMKSPTKLVPETEPYTQSWNVARYIERVRAIPAPQ